jgi:hypothetical protein
VTNGNIRPGPWAEERITGYTEAVREALENAGVPAAQQQAIVDDIRAQILEMIAARPDAPGAVESVLAAMDPPESYAVPFAGEGDTGFAGQQNGGGAGGSTPLLSIHIPRTKRLRGAGVFLLIFSTIMPAAVLAFELATRFCTSTLFDPVPNLLFQALVGGVAAANLFGWVVLLGRRRRHAALALFLNAFAAAVCLYYTIVFLPLMPFAAIALIMYGMGILPLSPVLTLWATLVLRSRLHHHFAPERIPWQARFPAGSAVGALLVVLAFLPGLIVGTGLRLASSDDPAQRTRGLDLLRRVGGENELLRACYDTLPSRPRLSGMGLLAPADGPPREVAREVYYRLTGNPFNSVTPPNDSMLNLRAIPDMLELNADNRDESTGFRDKRLSLSGSRIDGIVDPAAGTGYIEWTFTIANAAGWQREARAIIGLPAGAVVSRLTLWVNGEEREAAFAPRGKARQAYENVVVQRRDPVLVTTAGNDRVFMQCFPVPANGTFKARVGITIPLEPLPRDRVRFQFPALLDRNFSIPADRTHAVLVDSTGTMHAPPAYAGNLSAESGGISRLTADIPDSELLRWPAFEVERPAPAGELLYEDSFSSPSRAVRVAVREEAARVPSRIILVVDGSATMREAAPEISRAISELPDGPRIAAVFASDAVPATGASLMQANPYTRSGIAARIATFDYHGGQDNLPALEKALALAGGDENAAIVWIHAPQQVLLGPLDHLMQRLERSRTGPVIHELQVAQGRDRILTGISRAWDVRSVPRATTPGESLRQLFLSWTPGTARLSWTRDYIAGIAPDALTSAPRSAGHVARLAAMDLITGRVRRGTTTTIKEAEDLAMTYQLVTPVTGAVVLETREMFDRAGLKPVDPATVPTIPEPGTWVLIGIAALFLAGLLVARRRGRMFA